MAKLFCTRGRFRVPGALDQDPEPVEVELPGPNTEPVTRRLRLEDLGPERLSQLRDEVLKRRRRSARWALAPERIRHPVDRDDPAGLEEKERQDGPLLLPAEQKRSGLVRDLERPENSKVRHVTVVTRFPPAE